MAEADYSPPTGAKERIGRAILSLPQYVLMASMGQLHILRFLIYITLKSPFRKECLLMVTADRMLFLLVSSVYSTNSNTVCSFT